MLLVKVEALVLKGRGQRLEQGVLGQVARRARPQVNLEGGKEFRRGYPMKLSMIYA